MVWGRVAVRVRDRVSVRVSIRNSVTGELGHRASSGPTGGLGDTTPLEMVLKRTYVKHTTY